MLNWIKIFLFPPFYNRDYSVWQLYFIGMLSPWYNYYVGNFLNLSEGNSHIEIRIIIFHYVRSHTEKIYILREFIYQEDSSNTLLVSWLEPIGNQSQESSCYSQNQKKGELLIPLHGLMQFVRSDPLWSVNFHHSLRLHPSHSYPGCDTL